MSWFGGFPLPQPPSGSSPTPEPEPTVGDMLDIDIIAQDPVLRWRASRFAQEGLNPRQARALALDRTVDKEFVIERLLRRGCPPDIAFDIAS